MLSDWLYIRNDSLTGQKYLEFTIGGPEGNALGKFGTIVKRAGNLTRDMILMLENRIDF